jgi:nitroreductase
MNPFVLIRQHASLWRRRLRAFGSYFYDLRRFAAHSQAWRSRYDQMHFKGQLLRKLHSLEKGLSMPPPRRTFGERKIDEVQGLLARLDDGPDNAWLRQYAGEVMSEVTRFNQAGTEFKNAYPSGAAESALAVRSFSKQGVLKSLPPSPEDFFGSRRSVRIYDQTPVSDDLLRRAAELAQQAPSVCNRQSGRVRFYSKADIKAAILALQDGNKGFGHQIPTVALISSDLRCFHGWHERNQGYIDGGLFAMSLTFALHTLGLGSCMMNWCVAPDTDRDLRALLKIPDNEIVVTLMSIGRLPETYHVARSRRRPIAEVLLNI